jgi:hypothetical protein
VNDEELHIDKKLDLIVKTLAPRIDKQEVKRIVESNIKLDVAIGRDMEESLLIKNETYLLDNKDFIKTINVARNKLNITDDNYVDELDINNWISVNYEPKSFYDVVKEVLKSLNLGSEWSFYITVYVVNNKPPDKKYSSIRSNTGISIERLSESGELIIKLSPGLRRNDYLKAWDIFRYYLGSSSRLPKTNLESERDNAIFNDFNNGATKRKLANKYFPNQDGISSMEKISKILKRQKDRRTQK